MGKHKRKHNRPTTDAAPMVQKNIGAIVKTSQQVIQDGENALKTMDSNRKAFVQDGYQNMLARLGINEDNVMSTATYNFGGFITRQRQLLDAAYRTSWIIGQVVDVIAEDMTRAGILIDNKLQPKEVAQIQEEMVNLQIWKSLCSGIKWGRLYGGAIGIIMIEGQKLDRPFDISSVGKGSFKGLLILDRWLLDPILGDLIPDPGPNFGLPKYYNIIATSTVLPTQRVHHSRVIRFSGVELPFLWKVAENLWDESIVERIYDRLLAFDSTTQGTAQLVFKSHLRTVQIEGLRDILAAGGKMEEALIKQFEYIRRMQTNEGITLLDSKDVFEAHHYTFSGLDDVLVQFGQQLAGATGIPLVRLFGQSPKGMNATGESDLRNYYDNINKTQENHLRDPITRLIKIICKSRIGKDLPEGTGISFIPLWQLSDKDKAEIIGVISTAIQGLFTSGILSRKTCLMELRQSSRIHGYFSNITDKDIEDAEDEPNIVPGGDDVGSITNAVKHPHDKSGHFARAGQGVVKKGDNGGRET